MSIMICRAAASETDAVALFYDQVIEGLALGINYPGWRKDCYPTRETAEKGIAEGALFTAKLNGRLAGSMILRHEPEAAYRGAPWQRELLDAETLIVYTFAVHPDFAGRGVGRAMLEYAAALAVREGVKALRLDVVEGNLPAIRLYEKCGFHEIAVVDLGLAEYGLPLFRLYERLI